MNSIFPKSFLFDQCKKWRKLTKECWIKLSCEIMFMQWTCKNTISLHETNEKNLQPSISQTYSLSSKLDCLALQQFQQKWKIHERILLILKVSRSQVQRDRTAQPSSDFSLNMISGSSSLTLCHLEPMCIKYFTHFFYTSKLTIWIPLISKTKRIPHLCSLFLPFSRLDSNSNSNTSIFLKNKFRVRHDTNKHITYIT